MYKTYQTIFKEYFYDYNKKQIFLQMTTCKESKLHLSSHTNAYSQNTAISVDEIGIQFRNKLVLDYNSGLNPDWYH